MLYEILTDRATGPPTLPRGLFAVDVGAVEIAEPLPLNVSASLSVSDRSEVWPSKSALHPPEEGGVMGGDDDQNVVGS
jgi:hypothetical protein